MSATLEDLCQLMHDTYEAAAVRHGWHTNARSRVSWSAVPVENKASMRDAVAVVVEAVREDEREKYSAGTFESDLGRIMGELNLGTYARGLSPHEVVQQEILPKIRKIMQYDPYAIQTDLRLVMSALGITTNAHSIARSTPRELIKNEIIPKINKMKKTFVDVKDLIDDARKLL